MSLGIGHIASLGAAAVASLGLAALLSLPSAQRSPDQSRLRPPEESSLHRYPVHIHTPTGPPTVSTDQFDALGRPIELSCSSCHSVRASNRELSTSDALTDFHQGLTFVHGNLTCLACHSPADYDTLRLADGNSLQYTDVITLCAQCHGPQKRSYDHGAHGGMNGYWDLTRGPRTRDGCIDCHDPHAPAFPPMLPTFKPKDRFLEPVQEAGHE